MSDASDAGVRRITVAPIRWGDFSTWLAETRPDVDDPPQLRAQYAADLGRDRSRVISWPPRRNESCWCGSGRKYKKGCAAPGSAGSR